jgi:hypothetical protein
MPLPPCHIDTLLTLFRFAAIDAILRARLIFRHFAAAAA